MSHRQPAARPSRHGPPSALLTIRELLKQAPLFVPVDPADNGSQVSLVEALNERQKKDLFLNVRGEMEQLHDLCHTGSRYPAEAGQVRIIPDRFFPQQLIKPDGECHQTGDSGNRAVSRVAASRHRGNAGDGRCRRLSSGPWITILPITRR